MTLILRAFLILCSVLYFAYTIRKIRTSTVEFGDMLFWIIFSTFLLFMSIFPGVMTRLAELVGIQSPVNMVFLCIIAMLAYKCFSLALMVSALNMNLKTLVAGLAAREHQVETDSGRDDAVHEEQSVA